MENLTSENANLKNMYKSSEEARKGDKKNYSSLLNKFKIYEKDLFSLVGKLDCASDIKSELQLAVLNLILQNEVP